MGTALAVSDSGLWPQTECLSSWCGALTLTDAGELFCLLRLPRCHVPCVDTLQTPPLPRSSPCALFLALTVHFTGSTVTFRFRAAERLWVFGWFVFLYLLPFATYHPSPNSEILKV